MGDEKKRCFPPIKQSSHGLGKTTKKRYGEEKGKIFFPTIVGEGAPSRSENVLAKKSAATSIAARAHPRILVLASFALVWDRFRGGKKY